MHDIENRTFDELAAGDMAQVMRTLARQDIERFAVMAGDVNPAPADEDFATSDRLHKIIAHGMWGRALMQALAV